MKNRLFFKFLVIYILVGISGFILLSTVGASLIERNIITYESRNLYSEASEIAEDDALTGFRYFNTEDGLESEELTEIYESLTRLSTYQNCEIWLIRTDGTIFLNTERPLGTVDETSLADFDPVALGSDYYSVGTFFDYFDTSHLSVLLPITGNLNIYGYVAIHVDMADIISLRESLLANVHMICIGLYLILFSVFVVIFITLIRPLRKITEGINHFSAGDLKYNIDIHSNDEMGKLASSLNFMSDELNQRGEYEKSFIANVSHDFRSPLTSIKGFVEAMLDGTIPPEMQERYLKIVLSETERLTKLTNGILALNNIDSRKSMLNITTFDINEVIRNTAASFEGICRPRQISLNLTLTGETLPVSADQEKIQQVLYNLIDNAIKFSKDNSIIDIDSDIRHEKVFVSVKDYGTGIPSASLNKIWDRFYKTDVSRGRERKGNGLGLSIVKEIINQHKQTITVISTEGVGTEFVFTLAPVRTEEV